MLHCMVCGLFYVGKEEDMGTCIIIITTIITIIMVRSLHGNEMAAVGCRAAQDGAWAAVDVVVVGASTAHTRVI